MLDASFERIKVQLVENNQIQICVFYGSLIQRETGEAGADTPGSSHSSYWSQGRGGGGGGVRGHIWQFGREGGGGLMYKGVPQKLVGRRSQLRLHKDPLEEFPAVVRHVSGKHRVGGLSGDLKNGGHGFKLSPGRSLSQHLHNGAANAPFKTKEKESGREKTSASESVTASRVSPYVRLPAVALPADHLRAHPVGGASHRHDARPGQADGLKPPAGPEISQLDISHRVTKNVGP